jgi:hypothetical protein
MLRWLLLHRFLIVHALIRLMTVGIFAYLGSVAAYAGGPKYVAGVSYFNPAALGQPVIWQGGQVRYFVDQGPLGTLSNQQAVAMIDSAASLWSTVPTAAVKLTDAGALAEDVSGSNVLAGSSSFAAPSDVTPSATSTPIAIIFDSDGSVIDAIEGVGASTPSNCALNGPLVWIDNMNPNATFAHGVIVLNGRCTGSANLLATMSYQLERAFGRILGLDFSQVNDNAANLTASEPNGVLAWPVMQPINSECGPQGGTCIPNPGTLRLDDIAALNRLYPVTASNLAGFPGKQLTAANTVSIQGTISFRSGQGMQGVNVIARPLDANGNPLYQDTVTFVSGAYFAGNHGNPVTGWTDQQGNRLDRFGSNAAALEGYFDLSGMPLPPGVTSANYQVTFEPVNPLYSGAISVGPYLIGSPSPSGTLSTFTVSRLHAGNSQNLTVTAANSANGPIFDPIRAPLRVPSRDLGLDTAGNSVPESGLVDTPAENTAQSSQTSVPQSSLAPRSGAIGTEAQPQPLPATGTWTGRLAQIGQTDWFTLHVRANRIFTVVTQALNETGTPSAAKAMPAIGVWDGFDPIETAAAGFAPAGNGTAPGETWLQVATAGSEVVRLAIADQRGDGRPDYLYRGWVIYADTVSPIRLPSTGGVIVIRGTGFRTGDTVQVGGVQAQVTSILPTEITAQAPAAGVGVSGSQDVTVNDLPSFYALATIPGGLSYDSGAGDALKLVSAPANQVPLNVPQQFSVLALSANGNPAGGVTILYAVTSGTATLGCGLSTCAVSTTGDGRATIAVTATSASIAVVTASLTNGASVQAHFSGTTPPAVTALTPTLYLAAGASASWPVQTLVLSSGAPLAGEQVVFQSSTGITAPTGSATTSIVGIAQVTLTVGPLAEGQTVTSNACLSGTSTCAAFQAFGARPEYATLAVVSGVSQSMAFGSTAAPVTLRVLDMNGNPMAGGTVTIHQALYAWAPTCPAHGRCAQPQLLATQATTVLSALDGTITITPLALAGIPTNLEGIAATGNAGSLAFTIERHP